MSPANSTPFSEIALPSRKHSSAGHAEFTKQQQVLPPDRRLKVGLIYSYAPNEAEEDGFLDEEGFETDALDKSSRDFLEAAADACWGGAECRIEREITKGSASKCDVRAVNVGAAR